jgi:hypothetical protein
MNEVVQVRSDGWIDIIKACQGSGQTVKQWCSENNVNEGSYYYRLHQLRKALLSDRNKSQQPAPAVQFAKVPESPVGNTCGTALRIRRGNTVIEVSNDASNQILSFLREVMFHAEQ